MALTALIWPRFSATRITATGAISPIAVPVNTGAVKLGSPIQAALARPVKSIGLPMPMPLASTR